jgi:tetratricopeptide (TPR) repeat protein
LIWDDLHRVKDEIVNQTINQIEQLARDYGKKYMFIGASRMEGEYYQFKPEEIKLDEFRSLELIEECSAYFGVSVDGGVKEKLLGVGDGTPFYVISLFATSRERGKRRLMEDDLKTLPNDSFTIWQEHLSFLESEGRLSTSEKNVLRSIALAIMAVPAIDIEVLEKFYAQIFRGDLSEFDYALNEVVKKFFIGIEGEHCSMHAVQAAVVDAKYPVEERKIDRLKEVLTSLKRDMSLILLSAFADWLGASKKYVEYLKFLDVLIEKEPNIAEAYYNRGFAYDGLNQHERAIEDYDKAIELNPNLAKAYSNRGLAYADLSQYERAIGDYSKAIGLNPNLMQAYYNRGNGYVELNKHERAIEDYAKAIGLNPNFAQAYYNRGFAYDGLNQHERAIEDYDKAIELNPNLAQAYHNRGLAYAELNKHERAIEDYDKAIELNPKYAEAYIARGIACAELKQHDRAIVDFNKAIELNPKYAGAYYTRSNAYAELNKYEKAVEDYNKAIELNPNFAQAYCNRALTYEKLNQHGKAIKDCDKAIELNPDYAEAYINRGNAYAKLSQHERAMKDYNKAIESNPKYAGTYNNRGVAYMELKQYEKAIEDYGKAIALNPNDAVAYYNRGNAYADLTQHEGAIEDYVMAIALNPNFAKAYGNRGLRYAEIKKYEESARDMKKSGILFLNSGREEDSGSVFSRCFALRAKIENEDVTYSGLALFLLTKNANIGDELRGMRIQDETLRKIFELTLMKLRGEDISKGIATLEEEEKRKEMKILLELLRNL